jgi:hypothetical protein
VATYFVPRGFIFLWWKRIEVRRMCCPYSDYYDALALVELRTKDSKENPRRALNETSRWRAAADSLLPMSGGFATASATRLALAPQDDQLISQGTAPQSEINCICMVRKERFHMDDDDDPHEQILHIEAHIEELADVIESCRKFILISKAGMVAGGTLILAIVIGAVGFNPTVMIGALRLLSEGRSFVGQIRVL